ncbi:MAG: hypothetical protein GX483_07960 [Actinomycetaceae bacterium]|nr:hypothetical protein [Actinomycetaceae bacterium]
MNLGGLIGEAVANAVVTWTQNTPQGEQIRLSDGSVAVKQKYSKFVRIGAVIVFLVGILLALLTIPAFNDDVVGGFVVTTGAAICFGMAVFLLMLYKSGYYIETPMFVEVKTMGQPKRMYFNNVVKATAMIHQGSRTITLRDSQGNKLKIDTKNFRAPLATQVAGVVIATQVKPKHLKGHIALLRRVSGIKLPAEYEQYLYYVNARVHGQMIGGAGFQANQQFSNPSEGNAWQN